MRRALVPAIVVTLLIVSFQLTVLSSLRIEGVVVMLVWLWPFAMGLTGNTPLALATALFAGIFFDTHTTTPFGLTAAVGLVLAYGASRLGREGVGDLDSAAWWVTPVLAAVAGLAAPALYVVSGAFALDFNLWRGSVLSMMFVNAGAFFILARPVTRLARSVSNVGERVHR